MGEMMSKQYIKDKDGNIIGEYNSKLKGYRYKVKGENKSSVTTKIGKRTKPDLKNWYKRNSYDSIKEIMIMDNKPIDQINKFIQRVKDRAESKESYGSKIGSELHEWIDLYFKSKKQPAFPESEPLKTMTKKWLKFWKSQKFKLIASETPLYSPKFDTCGCNDVIVTKDSWKGQKAVIDWKSSKDYSFDQPI